MPLKGHHRDAVEQPWVEVLCEWYCPRFHALLVSGVTCCFVDDWRVGCHSSGVTFVHLPTFADSTIIALAFGKESRPPCQIAVGYPPFAEARPIHTGRASVWRVESNSSDKLGSCP